MYFLSMDLHKKFQKKCCQTIVPWIRFEEDGGVEQLSASCESLDSVVIIGTVRGAISVIGVMSSGGVT